MSLMFALVFFTTSAQLPKIGSVNTILKPGGNINYSTSITLKGDTTLVKNKVLDAYNYAKLSDAIEKVEVLHKEKNTTIYAMLYALPWPLDQRQSTSYTRAYHQQHQMILHTTAHQQPKIISEDAINMTQFYEKWKVTQQANNILEIEIEGNMNLGGDMPGWLVNSFIPSELKKSYLALAQQIQNEFEKK